MLDKSISEDLTAVTLDVTTFSADSLLLSLSLNSLCLAIAGLASH